MIKGDCISLPLRVKAMRMNVLASSLCEAEFLLVHPLNEGVVFWGISATHRFSSMLPIVLGTQVVLCLPVWLLQDGRMPRDFSHLFVNRNWALHLIQQCYNAVSLLNIMVFFQFLAQCSRLPKTFCHTMFHPLHLFFLYTFHVHIHIHTPYWGQILLISRSDFKYYLLILVFPNS